MTATSSRVKLQQYIGQAPRRPRYHQQYDTDLIKSVSRPRSLFQQRARPVSVRREGAIIDHKAIQGGRDDTLWQSFKRLSPNLRMFYGIGLAVFAVSGMYISDQLKARMPVSSEDVTCDAEGKNQPALFKITVVDRKA